MKEKETNLGVIKGGEKILYPTNIVQKLKDKGKDGERYLKLLSIVDKLNEEVIDVVKYSLSSGDSTQTILDLEKIPMDHIQTTCADAISKVTSTNPELFNSISTSLNLDNDRLLINTKCTDIDCGSITTVLYDRNNWEFCLLHKIVE